MAIISEQAYVADGSQREFQVVGRILSDSHIGVWLVDYSTTPETETRIPTAEYDVLGSIVLFDTPPAEGLTVSLILTDNGEGIEQPPSTWTNISANIQDINIVANNFDSVVIVGENIEDVNTVANDISNVNIVSSNIADINIVATDIENVNIVATSITNVNTVSESIDNVNNVGGSINSVNAVIPSLSDINTTANNIGSISLISSDLSNSCLISVDDNGAISEALDTGNCSGTSILEIVATNIEDIQIVADNIEGIQNSIFPSQGGNENKVLTTNGSIPVWKLIDENNLSDTIDLGGL